MKKAIATVIFSAIITVLLAQTVFAGTWSWNSDCQREFLNGIRCSK